MLYLVFSISFVSEMYFSFLIRFVYVNDYAMTKNLTSCHYYFYLSLKIAFK